MPEITEEDLPIPAGVENNVVSVILSLLNEKVPTLPVIVFCIRKQDNYDLAQKFLGISDFYD